MIKNFNIFLKENKFLNFSNFLLEAKNVHMQHIEDEILDDPDNGLARIKAVLKEIHNKLSSQKSSIDISVKFDGSPAIFFGKNPETNKFFVGTKAVFSKNSKAVYSDNDIKEYYSDKPDLAKILKLSLKYLPEIYPGKGVYQGDIMFTPDIKKKKKINNVENIIFKPNTIVYSVPKNSTQLYNEIDKKNIGLVIHTKYTGNSLQDMSSSFDVDINKFNKSKNVWFSDAFVSNFSGSVLLSKEESETIKNIVLDINKKEKSIKNIVNDLKEIKALSLLKIFAVRTTKAGNFSYESKSYTKFFVNWVKEYIEGEIQKLKSDAGKNKKREMLSKIIALTAKKEFYFLIDIYLDIVKIKEIILNKINTIGEMGTFIETENGFEVTKSEGFCIISKNGEVFKLVDRMEFSRINFQNK
jgi:hypothetical protein